MSQQVKVNFLNWRPDLGATEHDGLVSASEVFHQPEGYQDFKYVTSGAVSTLTSTDTTYWVTGTTILAMQCRPVGSIRDTSNNNKVIAYVRDGVSPSLVIDNLTGATNSAVGTGVAVYSGVAIRAFQVAELNNQVLVTAEAVGSEAGGTTATLRFCGYFDLG